MLRIGTSGFSFEDWIGMIYPEGIKKRDMLSYYENELGFNTLEVNYTYYRLPQWRTSQIMARKTSESFSFIVKSYREMTHEIPEGEKLDRIFELFKEGISPFSESGKLGGILLQFPPGFRPSAESFDYILSCRDRLGEAGVIVEFRSNGWVRDETFEFLKKNGIGFCCVDEPNIRSLMPFVVRITSNTGYFRFHGRNKRWFNVPVSERYNYLYSDEELQQFIPHINEISSGAACTYVFFNNCHAGAAAKNAIRMKELLGLKEEVEEKRKPSQLLLSQEL